MLELKSLIPGLLVGSLGTLALVSYFDSPGPAPSRDTAAGERARPESREAQIQAADARRQGRGAVNPFVPSLDGPGPVPEAASPPLVAAYPPDLLVPDAHAPSHPRERADREDGDERPDRAARRPEAKERDALRDKWKDLPKEQRRALRKQCDAQGLDKRAMECLKLVEMADYYAPPGAAAPADGSARKSRPRARKSGE